MSYYDDGYAGPLDVSKILCTGISPLILAGAGVVGYFIAKGGMKWVSLIGGVGLAAAQVFLCHAKI